MTQGEHDERSLELHRLVCSRIREHPELIDRARRTLERWEAQDSRRVDPATARWRGLLRDASVEALIQAATDPAEGGRQLRQSSPLATLLRPDQRWKFLEDWKARRGA